jgi:hypothetical protein
MPYDKSDVSTHEIALWEQVEASTLQLEVAEKERDELKARVISMVLTMENVQQGSRDMVKFSDDRALDWKHRAEAEAEACQDWVSRCATERAAGVWEERVRCANIARDQIFENHSSDCEGCDSARYILKGIEGES